MRKVDDAGRSINQQQTESHERIDKTLNQPIKQNVVGVSQSD
jgi:hypothetical protein